MDAAIANDRALNLCCQRALHASKQGHQTITDDLYQIRPARLDEIDAIRAIEQAAAQRFRGTPYAWVAEAEPGSTDGLRTALAPGFLLVADCSGVPVGFIQVMPLDRTAYIEEVDVLPEHAGHHLAARLIDAVAKRAAALGFATLTLSTFRDIPWNAPYYRRLGFRDLEDLGPGHRAIREKHRAIGLTEKDRVFMARPIDL